MNPLVYYLLSFAMAIITTTTTARPIPTPEDAYVKAEIEKALPGWVGTGAGIGATATMPFGVENPLLVFPGMVGGGAVGAAVGAAGATGYGVLAGNLKKGRLADVRVLLDAALGFPCKGGEPINQQKLPTNDLKPFWQGTVGGALGGAALGPKLRWLAGYPGWFKRFGGFSIATMAGMTATGLTTSTLRSIDPYNGICHRPDGLSG
ncbi:MAG: hypothetical protein M1816_007009 [Peltula sp. TS41687]|nr:MAG: hypothetical protein M1816_007009 [Peltula sp. TS41687]